MKGRVLGVLLVSLLLLGGLGMLAGGSLLAGGQVVTGMVDGADSGDLGHTLDVRLSGGTAYTTSLRVPIILIVIGLALTVLGARLVLIAVRGNPGSRSLRTY
jgi:hypothetical protein